jgi:uncharacterized protein YPO0396
MNLNIFKRIAALEEAQAELTESQKQISYNLFRLTGLIEQLQNTVNNNTVLKKTADEKKTRARAYAKQYYAKKKAEREGRKYVNFVKVSK